MDGFVSAYSKTTGEEHLIPEHWLEHPVLSRDFELAPSAKAAALAEVGDPDETWTRAQLDEHAQALGVDPSGLRNKGEVLDAIATAVAAGEQVDDPHNDPDNQDPGGTPPPDETPATGDNEEE